MLQKLTPTARSNYKSQALNARARAASMAPSSFFPCMCMHARAVAVTCSLGLLAGRLRLEVVGGGGTRTGDGAGRAAGALALVLLLLALLELGEEGLVLLVQLLRLPPQTLVLLHDEQVLQAQARVHPLHLFLPAPSLRSSCEP